MITPQFKNETERKLWELGYKQDQFAKDLFAIQMHDTNNLRKKYPAGHAQIEVFENLKKLIADKHDYSIATNQYTAQLAADIHKIKDTVVDKGQLPDKMFIINTHNRIAANVVTNPRTELLASMLMNPANPTPRSNSGCTIS
ncbi:MAG: hypothetical protein ABSF18_04095 [Gammaproteobacteria bacterium]|jgi:hypothetical protein